MRISKKLGLAALAAVTSTTACAGPVVETTHGKAEGVVVEGTEAYLNLPYAQAPEGKLRWREPVPAKDWDGVRDASKIGPSCYQADAGAGWGPYTAEFISQKPFSEDCLTVNVWKPAGEAKKRPVLVFIHGGGFGGGGAALPIYDGAALARRGVVVVTLQYRVGVFGFLAHPDLTAESPLHSSGNYGLLDQIEALKWVKANIANFSGDPENITVSGESAGASSVSQLIVSPLATGLFDKAIAFSGASMGIPVPSLQAGEEVGEKLARDLGTTTIAQLRNVSPADLITQTRAVPDSSGKAPELLFVPHVDNVVVRYDPSIGDRPIANNVPLMTGYNSAEMIDMSVDSPAKFEQAVRSRYGAFADKLLAAYPHANAEQARESNLLIARDRYMSGAILWGQARNKTVGEKVFVYLYDHPYPAAPNGQPFGTFHTSQLPYVFGNLGLGDRKFTPKDDEISKQWQDLIVAFMAKTNPSTPGWPWPATTAATGDKGMHIGDKRGFSPVVSSPERFAIFKEYAEQGGNLGLM